MPEPLAAVGTEGLRACAKRVAHIAFAMWVSAANRMAMFNDHKTATQPMVPSCAFGAHITSYVGYPKQRELKPTFSYML